MKKQWNKSGVIVFALMLPVAVFPSISVPESLIENGSFEFQPEEQGDIPGWLQYGSRLLEEGDLPKGAADGELVVDLKKTNALLQQQLSLPHNGHYEMRARHMLLREQGSGKVAKARILWGQNLLSEFKASNDNWRSRRFDLVASAGDGELLIERDRDDWAASRLIDDIRLYSTCRVSSNLVSNGSFEGNGQIVRNEKLTPWRTEYGDVEKYIDTHEGMNVAEGGNAARLTTSRGNVHLYQPMKTTPGKSYEISLDLSAVGQYPVDTSVELWWGPQFIANLDAIYHHWSSYTFVAYADRPKTRFRLLHPGDDKVDVLVDDVRIYEVDGTIAIEPFTAFVTPGIAFQHTPISTSDTALITRWSLKDAPDGMEIDARTGTITWMPDTSEDTSFTLVADAPGCAAHDEQLIQLEGNHNPQFTSEPVLTAVTGTPYVYFLMATDADNGALTYGFESAPSGMVLDIDDGYLYWYRPKIGHHNVILIVEDGLGGIAKQNFVIRVTDP